MTSPTPAVITGASGFVGRRLAGHFPGASALALGGEDWRERIVAAPLAGAAVFHLAARVHRAGRQDEGLFHRDNVEKTEMLARTAAKRGAIHLVFMSSVKVLGEESDVPFTTEAPYAPQDAYGRSKRRAEEVLRAVGRETKLRVTIVRSPLVYGAGAGGNLEALRRLCDSPWPLPFGGIRNRRSWIHVDDLASLLVACLEPGGTPFRTFHAAHPLPLATPDLVSGLRRALGRPARLVCVPPAMVEAGAALVGKAAAARRLTRSLLLDGTAATRELGWGATRHAEQAFMDLARGPA